MPRNPVNVKAMKLKPTDLPRLSWSVPPSKKIIAKGNTTAATRRPGSRMNLSMSRPAIAATAFSSRIAGRQDPEVGVFERGRLGPEQRQRLIDGTDYLVCSPTVEVDRENAVFGEGDFHLDQAAAERGAVI